MLKKGTKNILIFWKQRDKHAHEHEQVKIPRSGEIPETKIQEKDSFVPPTISWQKDGNWLSYHSEHFHWTPFYPGFSIRTDPRDVSKIRRLRAYQQSRRFHSTWRNLNAPLPCLDFIPVLRQTSNLERNLRVLWTPAQRRLSHSTLLKA